MMTVATPAGGAFLRQTPASQVWRMLLYLYSLLAFCGAMLWITLEHLGVNVGAVDASVVVTYAAIILLSSFGLAACFAKSGQLLLVMFWLFNLLFFGLGPLVQYLTVLFRFPLSEETLLKTNLVVLSYSVLFFFAYRRAFRKGGAVKQPGRVGFISPRALVVGALVSVVVLAAVIAAAGFILDSNMVLRMAGGYEAGFPALIASYFIRFFVYFLMLFAYFRWKWVGGANSPGDWAVLLVVTICCLALNSPVGGQRAHVFALYFGWLLVVWPLRRKRAPAYLALLLAGVFGAALIGDVRAMVLGMEGAKIQVNELPRFLATPNVDTQLAHVLDYVAADGPTWGRQMGGALLAWVPRTIWPSKPVGTGMFIFEEFVSRTEWVTDTNVTVSLLGEFYVDFGLPGVLLLTPLLGYACGIFDRQYKRHLAAMVGQARARLAFPRSSTRYMLLYAPFVGMFFYVLRGDLMSSVSFIIAYCAAFVLVDTVLVRPRRSEISLMRTATAMSPRPV
ncbi:MAG: O-antigen polymerase [Gemmatimonadota bacterium]